MKTTILAGVLLSALISVLGSCSQLPSEKPYGGPADSSFHITLQFRDISAGTMILTYESVHGEQVDTVAPNEKGIFIFEGSLNEPQLIKLNLLGGDSTSQNEFFMENNSLQITGQWYDRKSWTWRGSKTPADYDEYQRLTRDVSASINSTDSLIAVFQKSNLDIQARAMSGKMDSLLSIKRQATKMFMKNHPNSPVSLNQLILNFYAKATASEIKEAWELLDTSIQNMPDGQFFLREILKPALETDIGRQAPDFTLPDKDGKLITLSNLKGYYVLVDFWASWCLPCRKAIPKLSQLYDKYKHKSFELLSVSLDEEKESWLSAIRQDKHSWITLWDGKGFHSPVAAKYGVKAIPFTILLNRNGRIVSRNPSISEIERMLSDKY